jgi:myxalamid-type nonribosomal peptide synthetase MxaA
VTALELLSHLRGLDIRVWADGDRLRYSSPEGKLTPALRAELTRRKPEILAALREAELAVHPSRPPIVALPRPADAAVFPLSFAQERRWFWYQLDPDSSGYNISLAVRMHGPLDVPRLERSLAEIVRRHEALRTALALVDGEPRQLVAPAVTVTVPVVDLSALPAAEREATVRRLATLDVQRPVDLGVAPLMRARVYRLSDDEHVAVLVFDHSVFDAWSLEILERELALLYRRDPRDPASPPLPALPVQYADFAVWQRLQAERGALASELDYWRARLAVAPPLLELPADRPRPSRQTAPGAVQSFAVRGGVADALRTLCRREGVTLFMLLLAAFKALLYRYTGQDDLVVGTPTANRAEPGSEGVLGCFVNVLVLRTDLSGDPTFVELLRRVREVVLEAHAHQDLPFEMLVRAVNPERTLSHPPIFQVMVNVLNVPAAGLGQFRLGEPEITVTPLGGVTEGTIFDLELTARDVSAEIVGTLAYRSDLFDDPTIAQLLEHFQALLGQIAAAPDRRLSQMPIVGPAERHRILVEWNGRVAGRSGDYPISQRFEAQAARTPDAVAVVSEGCRMTYAELNRRANRLARVLMDEGVGPDVVVALVAERGIDLLTAMLAVFKAGGAYLPLDPRYPAGRNRRVLRQSGTPLVLTSAPFAPALSWANDEPSGPAPRVLEIDRMLERAVPDGDLRPRATPQDLAYVIYTSGSTGVPKGAMVEQRGMLNHLDAKLDDLRITDADRVAQTASQAFDISVWQFLAALLVGGQVHVLADEVAHDPARLLDEVDRAGITILEAVPSLLAKILEQVSHRGAGRPALASLRWLIPTGEALPPGLCRKWFGAYPHVPVMNAYGPTECSDDVAHHPMTEPPDEGALRVPIGRPIRNMRLYVLDRRLQPVPSGVVGELFVGGIGVGRGYLGDPARTAEAFIPDPFSAEPGARLYRTGDLARWLKDGTVDFLRRADEQVKIRGFRVELGEVASALAAHPAVREAVAVVREDRPGDGRLVAYLTVEAGRTATAGELRRFLKERLPEYMVPSALVALDALPLTPNGKLDRAALPPPDLAARPARAPFAAPRDAVEDVLARIWTEVLACDRVGVEDDFFELGGHSLAAVDLIDRVRKAFQVELTVRDFFGATTVAELAKVVRTIRRDGPSAFAAVDVAGLDADAALDPAMQPAGPAPDLADEPGNIFLTGATGFLGAFLLAELLERTRARVHCLVRPRDEEEAARKLRRKLESFLLWREEFADRIVVVPGDLSLPRFGLGEREFEALTRGIDVIFHSGAWVNLLYPYRTLAGANVSGTREVVRLAMAGRAKPLHHVSTVSVFSSVAEELDVVREDARLEDVKRLYGGYAQTKWVAERLVMSARDRGLPVCIYRPHRVTGHSRTGAWNADDLVCRVVKACVQLGIVPDLEAEVEMVPVDYVSRAIVHLSRQSGSVGKAFNLVNPHTVPLSELIAWIRSIGYRLEVLPHAEWQARTFEAARHAPENALYPIAHLVSERVADELTSLREEMRSLRLPRFDCRNALAGLAGTSIACPAVDPPLLARSFAYLVRSGVLVPPRATAA